MQISALTTSLTWKRADHASVRESRFRCDPDDRRRYCRPGRKLDGAGQRVWYDYCRSRPESKKKNSHADWRPLQLVLFAGQTQQASIHGRTRLEKSGFEAIRLCAANAHDARV